MPELRGLLHDTPLATVDPIDVGLVQARLRARHRRQRARLAALGAALVVAVGSIAVPVIRSSDRGERTVVAGPGGAGAQVDPGVRPTSADQARLEAKRVLDAFRLPPGAVPTPTPKGFAGGLSWVDAQSVVEERTWRVGSPAQEVYDGLREKAQDDMTVGSYGSDGASLTIGYDADPASRSPRLVSASVIANGGAASNVTVRAEVAWAPRRRAASLVAVGAVVTVERSRGVDGSGGLSPRTVDPPLAEALVADVNQLEPDTRGGHGCAADNGSADVVRFVEGTTTWKVTVNRACSSASIERNGEPAGGFQLEGPLTADLDAALR
jgi:hypothetical protein